MATRATLNWFQSHAGSIEAMSSLLNSYASKTCFNPTLVRLRPRLCYSLQECLFPFQSHAGSIEAFIEKNDRMLEIGVSIPRWFD